MATTVVIPSNPEDQKKIRGALQEIADAMTRITAERELIKDIKDSLKEDFELPPKFITKMAKTYFSQNFDAVVTEADDFQTLYETICCTNND